MRRRLLFPSPVFFDRPAGHEGLRAELRQRALHAAEGQRGWRSPPDLLARPESAFRDLHRLLLDGLTDAVRQQALDEKRDLDIPFTVRAAAWMTVLRRGEYLSPQRQADAHWAGFYTVDAGDQPPDALPAGSLSFLDPRGAIKGDDPLDLASTHHELAPVDGLLLIFPGWLQHHTHPYAGQRPRVLVGFTLTLQPAAPAPRS